jgi:predicted kinase
MIEQPKWTYSETFGLPAPGHVPPTVVLTCGLPASGKTTWAEDFTKRHSRVRLVCRDDFRRRDPDYRKGVKNFSIEKAAKQWRDDLMCGCVALGEHVIIADTNLNLESRIADVQRLLRGKHYRLMVADFRHVSVEDCLKRDKLRQNSVGSDVIVKLFYQHLVPEPVKMTAGQDWRDRAVFVDLDGTTAIKHNGRDHYAKEGFLADHPNEHVINMINSYMDNAHKNEQLNWAGVFFLTGRGANKTGRKETYEWVKRYFPRHMLVESSTLFREENDMRPDYVVKREMYDHVKETMGYTPVLAFDDRPQVCRMWDLLGLNTIKIGPYYEF